MSLTTAEATMILSALTTAPLLPSPGCAATARVGPLPEPPVNRAIVHPNEPGSSRHAHPLVSTYEIAVNTARGSTGARGMNAGTRGSTIAQD